MTDFKIGDKIILLDSQDIVAKLILQGYFTANQVYTILGIYPNQIYSILLTDDNGEDIFVHPTEIKLAVEPEVTATLEETLCSE